MRIYGYIKQLVELWMKKDGQDVKFTPNSNTYVGTTSFSAPPRTSGSGELVGRTETQTLTGKTLDGDDNTIQDLPVTAIKTVLGDANKALVRDASGVPTSALIVNANVDAAAAIAATKIADGSVDNTEFQKLGTAGSNATGQLVTTDGTQLLQNKTIDGDENTVQDLPLTAIKTALADANKVIRRDASGVIQSGNTLPNSSAIVTTDATQALTNKDIDGATASNTSRITLPKASSSTLSGLTRKQATLVYDTDTNQVKVDDGTTLNLLAGSGSGEINAVLNPNDANAGWAAGTSHTVSTLTSGSPLAPVITTAIRVQATANATESSTSGGAYTISTFPTVLRNRKNKVQFSVISPSADTWRLSVYSGSTRMALSTDSSGATTIPAGLTGIFTTTFDADSSTSYTVRLTRTGGTGTTNLDVTNVIVGPGIQPQGAVVGNWTAYTPTTGGVGTPSVNSAFYRRTGDSIEIRGFLDAGTVAASPLTIALPSGLTINTSVLNGGLKNWLGMGNVSTAAGTNVYGTAAVGSALAAVYNGSDTSNIYFTTASSTDASGNSMAAAQNGSGILSNGSQFSYHLFVPVAEWAGNGTVNLAQNDVEYVYNTDTSGSSNTTAFGYGPQGALFSGSGGISKRVRFSTPIQPTDTIWIEINEDTSGTGTWKQDGGSILIIGRNTQNGTNYGMWTTAGVNATDVDVFFGEYRQQGATFGGVGSAWSGITDRRWRVVKAKAGTAVGFGLATTTSAGIVNPYTQGSGVVYSGTWSPTATNFTGASAVSITGAKFLRVGNIVQFSFRAAVTRNALGDLFFKVPLPSDATSNFTDISDVSGAGAADNGNLNAAQLYADTTNDVIQFFGQTNGASAVATYYVTGQYLIR
jgi:hypothetical protein